MEADFKLIFGLFITVIVAIALVDAIGDAIFSANNPVSVTWENVSIEAGRLSDGSIAPNVTFSLANDYIISINDVGLSNGSTMTLGTDYHLNHTALDGNVWTFSMINSTIVGNSDTIPGNVNYTNWNYTHAGDAYVQGGGVNRTLLSLVVLFFVIGILAAALMFLTRTEIFKNM